MKNIKLLTTTALLAAITCALTFAVRFPTAVGYIHPGDSVIYLAACVLPFPYALIAGAIGGGLSDLFSGFPLWIAPTLVIKALIALPYSCKSDKILTKRNVLMVIPAGLITVAGYFVAALILSPGYAVSELAGSFTQAAISGLLFIAVGAALDRVNFKQRLQRILIWRI